MHRCLDNTRYRHGIGMGTDTYGVKLAFIVVVGCISCGVHRPTLYHL